MKSMRPTRAPFAVAAVIAILALATGCAPSSGDAEASVAPAAGTEGVAVRLADFELAPVELTVTGPEVTFTVTNEGPTPHNFSVRDASGEIVLRTSDLSPGESETISGTLEPGEYGTLCSLAGHHSLGMSGTLTVTAP